MLHLKNFLCIKSTNNALVAESVDAADLKSVGIYPVPVQVWPSAPIRKAYKSTVYEPFLFLNFNISKQTFRLFQSLISDFFISSRF